MNYDVVTLEEKKVVGLAARTGNGRPDMQQVIGGLWQKYYEGGICTSIKNKVNEHALGIYSAYEKDTYQVTVGAEVSSVEKDEDLVELVLPAGTYAHFHVFGNQVTAVAEAWAEIWKTDLKRTWTGDFEEYTAFDGVNATVEIYVAIEA